MAKTHARKMDIDPEQSEFAVRPADRHRTAWARAFLPLLTVAALFPPWRRRLSHWITRLFEHYACMAYYYDDGDVGFFESFLLEEKELQEILNDLSKRTTTMKKDMIMQREGGSRPSMDDIDELNNRCSLTDKKLAALKLVSKKGLLIQYFGKRIEKLDPGFYRKLEILYRTLAIPEVTASPEEPRS